MLLQTYKNRVFGANQLVGKCEFIFIRIIMEKKWILVIDSGIGGRWTLEKIKKILPNENYLFFMDKTHAPYGNKSKSQLLKIAEKNVTSLLKLYDIKLVVLACNTLSSVCYEHLKRTFVEIPFIKIEPYFEPEIFQNLPTLLLATKSTIKYNKRIKEYKKYANIYLKGFGNLAKKIDASNDNFQEIGDFLSNDYVKNY